MFLLTYRIRNGIPRPPKNQSKFYRVSLIANVCLFSLFFDLDIEFYAFGNKTNVHINIYIYIYICVCVYVCVRVCLWVVETRLHLLMWIQLILYDYHQLYEDIKLHILHQILGNTWIVLWYMRFGWKVQRMKIHIMTSFLIPMTFVCNDIQALVLQSVNRLYATKKKTTFGLHSMRVSWSAYCLINSYALYLQ